MLDLRIGGFTPFSASDFPDHLAAVVFCQGCPWECAYCHNAHLQSVTPSGELDWSRVIDVLGRRRGRLDAVVFSGGEPTLQRDLLAAMDEVKALGFEVGLHTAGMYPERLERVLSKVDWVGLDLKAPFADYEKTTRVPGSGLPVRRSLELILQSGAAHELRLTWHPALVSARDVMQLLDEVETMGGGPLVLQEYRPIGCREPLAPLAADAVRRLWDELPDHESRLRLRGG